MRGVVMGERVVRVIVVRVIIARVIVPHVIVIVVTVVVVFVHGLPRVPRPLSGDPVPSSNTSFARDHARRAWLVVDERRRGPVSDAAAASGGTEVTHLWSWRGAPRRCHRDALRWITVG